jgi:hypothetical protein
VCYSSYLSTVKETCWNTNEKTNRCLRPTGVRRRETQWNESHSFKIYTVIQKKDLSSLVFIQFSLSSQNLVSHMKRFLRIKKVNRMNVYFLLFLREKCVMNDREYTGRIINACCSNDKFSSVSFSIPNNKMRERWGDRRMEKTHNEELHDLYSSPSIIRIIKTTRMRWTGHVARMGRRGTRIGCWWESH